MTTPVLFLIHRRPRLTQKVFQAIREVRPPVLLVAADGPSDDSRCRETRSSVLNQIDWPCSVETRLLEDNEGCKLAVSGALDWAFSRHARLIVIEDDCLPSPSFFQFCEELLNRYENVPKVMQICGANLSGRIATDGSDYYVSRFATIWGWASWRRSWATYDLAMSDWPCERERASQLANCTSKKEWLWRLEIFNAAHCGEIDTWDHQWEYAKWKSGGLSLIPSRNLVSNLGWGNDATHTHDTNDPRAAMPADSLFFPLRHPVSLCEDSVADQAYFDRCCREPSFARRALNKLRRFAKRPLP